MKRQPNYGDKRDYRKIDIFVKAGRRAYMYKASTTWSRTCTDAADRWAERNSVPRDQVRAWFSKNV